MNTRKLSLTKRPAIAPALQPPMRRLLLLAVVIIACAPIAFAQGADDYNKVEVYGGYSLGRVQTNVKTASFTSGGGTETFANLCSVPTGDMIGHNFQRFFCTHRNFNGFDGSLTYNVSRYVGIKGDVTGHFRTASYVDNFTPPGLTQTVSNRERLYNFLGGVQIKNNSKTARLKPFAHALGGVARYTNRQQQTIDLFPAFNFVIEDQLTSLALKFGGGLDLRMGKRLDIRVIEFDYNPVFAGDRKPKSISGPFTVAFTGRTAHNYSFGVGIVIH